MTISKIDRHRTIGGDEQVLIANGLSPTQLQNLGHIVPPAGDIRDRIRTVRSGDRRGLARIEPAVNIQIDEDRPTRQTWFDGWCGISKSVVVEVVPLHASDRPEAVLEVAEVDNCPLVRHQMHFITVKRSTPTCLSHFANDPTPRSHATDLVVSAGISDIRRFAIIEIAVTIQINIDCPARKPNFADRDQLVNCAF